MNTNDGYIFCLTNKSFANTVKCGTTTKDLNMYLNELNFESSKFIPTPYVIEFAKYVRNVTKTSYNMFCALNAYSKKTGNTTGTYEDLPDRVKTIFDCIDGTEWNNNTLIGCDFMSTPTYGQAYAPPSPQKIFPSPGAAYQYDHMAASAYGNLNYDVFGSISDLQQKSPPASMMQMPHQPIMMPQQQMQQQQPIIMPAPAPQIIMATPAQQPIIMAAPVQSPILSESIEKTIKRAIKKDKEKVKEAVKKEEKKKKEDEEKKKKDDEDAKTLEESKKKPEFEVKGVRSGKSLNLYFTDGQTIRHNINITADGVTHKEDVKSTKMGIYMKKHDAIVCDNVRYVSLAAFVADHRTECGGNFGQKSAWAECEYKDGKKWISTSNMQLLND